MAINSFSDEELERMGRRFNLQTEINGLKQKLSAEYDYIGIKIAMGVATREEYADKIAEAEAIREEVRQLESELKEL